jgi:hypothetical protein
MKVAKNTGAGGKRYEKGKFIMVRQFDCSIDEYSSCQRAG